MHMEGFGRYRYMIHTAVVVMFYGAQGVSDQVSVWSNPEGLMTDCAGQVLIAAIDWGSVFFGALLTGIGVSVVHVIRNRMIEKRVKNGHLRADPSYSDRVRRALFSSVRLGHVVTDGKGRITDANRAFLEWIDCSLDELLNQSFDEWVLPLDADDAADSGLETASVEENEGSFVSRKILTGDAGECLQVWVYRLKVKRESATAVWWILEPKISSSIQMAGAETSETELRSVLESLDCGVVFLDPKGSIQFMNDAGCRILGLNRGELIHYGPESQFKFIRPDGSDLPETERPALEALNTGYPVRNREMGVKHRDGSIHWILVNAQLVYTVHHEVSGVVVSFYDSKEKRERDILLLQNERQFQATFEQSATGMCFTGLSGKILRVNSTFCEMLQYVPDELVGQHFNTITHPDDREKSDNRVLKLLTNGSQKVQFEKRYRCKDGNYMWASVNSVLYRDESEVPQFFITQIIDITHRVEAEERIRSSECKYRALVEQSLVGIYMFSKDRFLFVNQRFCEIFGYTQKELLEDMNPTDVISKDYLSVANEHIEERLSGEVKSVRYVAKGNHKQGRNLWVEIHGTLIEYEGMKAITGTVLDFTVSRTAEEELYALNQDLEQGLAPFASIAEAHSEKLSRNQVLLLASIQELKDKSETLRKISAELANKNEELQAFSFTVSHDLRAPLRAISSFSNFLLEDHSHCLDVEGKRLLGVIRDNVRQMDELIVDLLNLSTVSHRKLEYATIDMQVLFNDVFSGLADAEKGFGLAHFEASGLPKILADGILMRQVCTNLISNALKYSRGVADRKIWVEASDEGVEWVFGVHDSGIGFDPQYLPKLFGIFERLHTQDQFEGTGVGLAIVKRVIMRHGGRVWAESTPGMGAAFYFTLPKQRPEPVA